MAEGVGFEPTEPFGSPVFKTGAIDHSTTPPLSLPGSLTRSLPTRRRFLRRDHAAWQALMKPIEDRQSPAVPDRRVPERPMSPERSLFHRPPMERGELSAPFRASLSGQPFRL